MQNSGNSALGALRAVTSREVLYVRGGLKRCGGAWR